MKTKGLHLLIGIVVIMITVSQSNAAGTSGAQFLKLGAGARAASMGDAFSSVADDVSATYWNPAGLAQIPDAQVSFMQNKSLLDTTYQYLGMAYPHGKNTFGAALHRMDYGSIDGYSVTDTKTQSFTAGSMAASLIYAREITEGFRIGFAGKYITDEIDSKKASAMAADIGIHLSQRELNRFNFSLVLQNLGSSLKYVQETESLPQIVRFGISNKMLNEKLLAAVEFSKPHDNDGTIHFGTEYNINSVVAIRGGYQTTPGNQLDVSGLKNVTGGLGINVNQFTLDYALVPFGDLGMTHRVSFLMHFTSVTR